MSHKEFSPLQFIIVIVVISIVLPAMIGYYVVGLSEWKVAYTEAAARLADLSDKFIGLTGKVELIQHDYSFKYAQTKTLRHLIDFKTLSGDDCVKLSDIIRRKSLEVGISEDAVIAMILAESDGNPKSTIFHAIDGKVLEGLCGVRGVAVKEAIGKSKYSGDNPSQNILAWFSYMEYVKTLPQFKDCTDEIKLLKAWNRGPFHKDYSDAASQKYARKIKYFKEQLR